IEVSKEVHIRTQDFFVTDDVPQAGVFEKNHQLRHNDRGHLFECLWELNDKSRAHTAEPDREASFSLSFRKCFQPCSKHLTDERTTINSECCHHRPERGSIEHNE